MDLASMLEREDFFPSFFFTVQKYYKEAMNTEISFSFASTKKECNMVIKPRLSAVSSIHMSRKAREFYYSEWNIRNSILKYLIVKAYVFFMTRTGRHLSQFQFEMIPKVDNFNDIVIAPNNRSIRFFDYRENTVGCMIKEGFTDKFFRNQIEFRKHNHYEFMLPLTKYGEDWFQEPIMHGHPLARVRKEKIYRSAITEAINDIMILAGDSLEYKDCSEYVNQLKGKLMNMLGTAILKKDIKLALESEKIIEYAAQEALIFEKPIPLVMSHGDFQTGNIWVDKAEKVWIYDWETVAKRSIWYDTSVLQYSLRRAYGWKDFMELSAFSFPQMDAYVDGAYSSDEIRGIKGIVMLEDLCFYLEDMLELPEKWGSELFDAFINRLIDIDIVKNNINAG